MPEPTLPTPEAAPAAAPVDESKIQEAVTPPEESDAWQAMNTPADEDASKTDHARLAALVTELHELSTRLLVLDENPAPKLPKGENAQLSYSIKLLSSKGTEIDVSGEVTLTGYMSPRSVHTAIKTMDAAVSTLMLVPLNQQLTQMLEDIRQAQADAARGVQQLAWQEGSTLQPDTPDETGIADNDPTQ